MNAINDMPNCPFEVHGYFEEIFDAEYGGMIGTRHCPKPPDDKFGHASRKDFVITEPIELTRGAGKKFTLKASQKKPLQLIAYTQILCGKLKEAPQAALLQHTF